MAKHHVKENIVSPWWVRKAIYTAASVIGLGLVALNIVDPAQVDKWSEMLTPVVSVIVAAVGGLAAVKTGSDSDDNRPVVDVEDVADLVADVVAGVVDTAGDRVVETVRSFELPVYDGPTSAA